MYHSHELFLFIDYFESLIKLFILKFLIYKVITCYKEFKREYVNAVDWEFISFWFKWASKKSGLDQLEHGNPWSQSAALSSVKIQRRVCECVKHLWWILFHLWISYMISFPPNFTLSLTGSKIRFWLHAVFLTLSPHNNKGKIWRTMKIPSLPLPAASIFNFQNSEFIIFCYLLRVVTSIW